MLQFSISDSGVGIPPDSQRTIFEAFPRADGSTTRQYVGTGLGLTISWHLVQLMGGRISVESRVGAGSTFLFAATFGVGNAVTAARVMPDVDLQHVTVLIVDDSATNRYLLARMLLGWRMSPTVAENGSDALALLRAARQARLSSWCCRTFRCRMPTASRWQKRSRLIRRSPARRS